MSSRQIGIPPYHRRGDQYRHELEHQEGQGNQRAQQAAGHTQAYNPQWPQAQLMSGGIEGMRSTSNQYSDSAHQAHTYEQRGPFWQPNFNQYPRAYPTATESTTQSPGITNNFCNNCGSVGHLMQSCMKMIDSYGYMTGCPPCNTKQHNYRDPQACKYPHTSTSDLYFIVICRHNRPPLKVDIDYRGITGFGEDRHRPWTAEYALRMEVTGYLAAFEHKVHGRELIADPAWGDMLSFNNKYPPGALKHPDYLTRPALAAPLGQGSSVGQDNPKAPLPDSPLTWRQLRNARRSQRRNARNGPRKYGGRLSSGISKETGEKKFKRVAKLEESMSDINRKEVEGAITIDELIDTYGYKAWALKP